jgi:SOS-response transcriptional repressor LexA
LEQQNLFPGISRYPVPEVKRKEVTMVSKYNTERKYLEGQENRKEIYLFLIRYFTKYGYAPSFKEIAENFGISKAIVQRHMRQLELDGLIATAHPNTPRAFRLVGYEYQKVEEV